MVGPTLFSDPAWDILLSLYLNTIDHHATDMKTMALDTDTPQTTVIRWINELEKLRLVERSVDPADRRRVLVTLTPAATDTIERLWQPGALADGDD